MKKFLLLFISILSFSFLILFNSQKVSASYYADYYGQHMTYTTISLYDDFEFTGDWITTDYGYCVFAYIPIEKSLEDFIYILGDKIYLFMRVYNPSQPISDFQYVWDFDHIPSQDFVWTTQYEYLYILVKEDLFDSGCNPQEFATAAENIKIDTWVISEPTEVYQQGYNDGYQNGFNDDNRIKIALWEYNNISYTIFDTVFRFNFNNFISAYGIISGQGLTTEQIKSKIFIPTFDGFLGSISTSVRQWYLYDNDLQLFVERHIIEKIVSRENVGTIDALKIYLQTNNIYGYFERADGKTKYRLGYDEGYNKGLEEQEPESYKAGYDKGKQDGYDEATEKFKKNFGLKVDVWLVPAIIIVFAIGIFVTYRRGRE